MEIPKTCNWVDRRAKCSAEHLFLLLLEVLDSDVKEMEAVKKDKNLVYGFAKPAASKAVVSRLRDYGGGMKDGDAVVFERTRAGTITATKRPGGQRIFEAQPWLDDDGGCRLRIGTKSFYLWQISRLALEELFFSEPDV